MHSGGCAWQGGACMAGKCVWQGLGMHGGGGGFDGWVCVAGGTAYMTVWGGADTTRYGQ